MNAENYLFKHFPLLECLFSSAEGVWYTAEEVQVNGPIPSL